MQIVERCDTVTYVEGAASLDGKEDQLVQLDAGGLLVLADGTLPVIGVYKGKLTPGSKNCAVAPIGAGLVRMIQEAAIGVGVRVQAGVAPNKVKARAASGLNFGVKVYPRTNGAAGDVILVQGRLEVS